MAGGNFDDEVRAAMRMSQRGDPQQQARDQVARQRSGGVSTAYAPQPQGAAQTDAQNTQVQLPKRAPIPEARAMDAAISQTMAQTDGTIFEPGGSEMPTQVAYEPGGGEMPQQTAFAPGGSNVDAMIADQLGSPESAAVGAGAPQPVPREVASEGSGISGAAVAAIAAVGGAAGLAALARKYMAGDPNATAQVDQLTKETGLSPDQLATVAQQSDAGAGTLAPGQSAAATSNRATVRNQSKASTDAKAKPQGKQTRASKAEPDVGTKPRNWTQADDITYPGQAKKPAWTEAPNSRAKVKVKPKAK